MHLPELGAAVRLYPAPVANAELKPGRPVPLRRVQDGAGNYGRFLPEEGAERVFAYATHAVLSGGAVERVSKSALESLVVTNSIAPTADMTACAKIRILDIAPLLGEAMRRITNEESVSSLFD